MLVVFPGHSIDKHLGKAIKFCIIIMLPCFTLTNFYFQYEFHRNAFDETMNSVEKSKVIPAAPDVKIIVQRLLFFYSHSKDNQRLVRVYHYFLCQATMFFFLYH